MAPTELQTDAALADDVALANLVEQMADEFRQHGQVNIESWQSRYPQLASELARLVPTLGLLADISAAADTPSDESHLPFAGGKTLGDFRIAREIGRGGMGIVYEAEQLSLNRRVALKTLPTAAVLDPRTLQRFKNEAQAAAALDHPHIVAVHGVGVERGVHYYAMRLIEGCTLADVIDELRGQPAQEPDETAAASELNRKSKIQNPKSSTARLALLSTIKSDNKTAFFRAVAELGRHVADALDHAHAQGVIHRDIKPSNLLLDGQGKVWVTDFGLAHIETNQTLTLTGDLLGTLRYMSPEQALANRVPIDHRTDIYSLGATLYELLTLEPLFAEQERPALLQRIAFTEPVAPRKLNPRIPADLETILLKMLEKDPASRYASARDLADDLARFAGDEPIHARRRSWSQRLAKWSARNRSLVVATTAVALASLLIIGALVGWQARDEAARRAVAASLARRSLASAAAFTQQKDWPRAIADLKQAETALSSSVAGDNPLLSEVQTQLHDAEFAWRLENIRLLAASTVRGDFDFAALDRAYAAALAARGIDTAPAQRNQTVSQVRHSPLAGEIAAALTNWSIARRHLGSDQRPNALDLIVLAKEIDNDPWRNRLRDAFAPPGLSPPELGEFIANAPLERFSAPTLFLLAQAAANQRLAGSKVEQALRAAQRRYPGDFWLNFAVARYFESIDSPQLDESIRYYTAALALRPGTAAVHNNQGTALHRQSRRSEAIAEYRRAITCEPQFAAAYSNLGFALYEEGELTEAERILREGLAIRADWAETHSNLGLVLLATKKPELAANSFRTALRLDPSCEVATRGLADCERPQAKNSP